jgi:hypothetical protein
MPLIVEAEGGRSWPSYPCGPDLIEICGPEDVDAWGRRLSIEIEASNVHLGELSPGGNWLGPAAANLASEIQLWQDAAREWANTDYWHTAVGLAEATAKYARPGTTPYEGVVGEVARMVESGIALNNRARLMIWEASQQSQPTPAPAPAPLICPDGYVPVSVTQPDGTVLQYCQGVQPGPVPPDELETPDEAGDGLLLIVGAAAVLGAWYFYSNRGSISGSILRGLR